MQAPHIHNQTRFDGRTVSAIVRWVFRHLDLDGEDVMVKVKHTRKGTYAGRFYPDPHWVDYVYDSRSGNHRVVMPSVPADVDHLLVCRVAPDGYPRMNHVYDRKDSPGAWEIGDWREALVSVTAHEAMHLRQHRHSNRYSEVETEWAAYRLWREWCGTRRD